ncbi:MAG: 16S rRNA (adenine(1518)-N(6)/adenine(1519)-N(6))-dimethyltransferase RsmA [Xanthomonadales bacterium]|jgi:16S rRNA (adenine1518-N6/adenine1519-N6)-dimethyltransferase|nr:16S rRNA (adenine(1518)-N(6)/adenine(1519)-N(6))-dimethyltransferase RsmA [Xanthomonadales bacterium]
MQHRPRKRFGQNFLADQQIIERIVNVIAPGVGQVIVEIGPGEAALTTLLAASGAELHLLEIDRDLGASLEQRFALAPNVHLHRGDALQMDLSALTSGQRFRLVGNLPYNISTPLLFHALRWSDLIVDMHFMLQQEVVNRMAAQPGGKAWGRLSIMCQYRCTVTPLFTVPPEAFRPAPKVQSAIVRLVPHPKPPVHITDMARFERLVAQAFSMRRKTLRNCLRGLLDADAIAAAGIDPGLRPEALDLSQFAALAERMNAD